MAGSRWNEARDALMGLVKFALKHDDDGVEIAFFNAVDSGKVVHVSAPHLTCQLHLIPSAE